MHFKLRNQYFFSTISIQTQLNVGTDNPLRHNMALFRSCSHFQGVVKKRFSPVSKFRDSKTESYFVEVLYETQIPNYICELMFRISNSCYNFQNAPITEGSSAPRCSRRLRRDWLQHILKSELYHTRRLTDTLVTPTHFYYTYAG